MKKGHSNGGYLFIQFLSEFLLIQLYHIQLTRVPFQVWTCFGFIMQKVQWIVINLSSHMKEKIEMNIAKKIKNCSNEMKIVEDMKNFIPPKCHFKGVTSVHLKNAWIFLCKIYIYKKFLKATQFLFQNSLSVTRNINIRIITVSYVWLSMKFLKACKCKKFRIVAST